MKTLFFHKRSKVNTIYAGKLARSIFHDGKQCLAVVDDSQGSSVLAVDSQGSVVCLGGLAAGTEAVRTYSAYGASKLDTTDPHPVAFTGELFDHFLSGYYLGRGYRIYSPALRRFFSPDVLSPFGRGGRNSYGYCSGDPVNFTDPSGGLRERAMFNWGRARTAILRHVRDQKIEQNNASLNLGALARQNLNRQGRLPFASRSKPLRELYPEIASTAMNRGHYHIINTEKYNQSQMLDYFKSYPDASSLLSEMSALRTYIYMHNVITKSTSLLGSFTGAGMLPHHRSMAMSTLAKYPSAHVDPVAARQAYADLSLRMEPWTTEDIMKHMRHHHD
ncbi:RHS repeat-associated core domain-containing protein [Pseudomonas fakonensis]|uniref:RHS repeat-associated core domain-containing protein n=1 Tax=Pseudomonas fakonensis TaxID=2842355 RepID=A0ABX8MXG5_9PSED|nr:RHS repeat-associated core domain-containing protein [Pseudomonas fakonensis]QXH49044.1 RHS repeat-associated core domain-containing protein [Pseudomonas fakonensis]